MNPLTNMKNVKKLSEQELRTSNKTSWHDQYKNSAWIFVGGLPYDLTEGDVICIFSQYGEIVNINLVRDKDTGKQKGFCFICYEDQRSTVLAVDNFNGIKLLQRIIRVDHVQDYKVPKESKNIDEKTRQLQNEGCAPGAQILDLPKEQIDSVDIRLPERLPIYTSIKVENENSTRKSKKAKKDKKSKKKEKKSKKKKRKQSTSSSSESANEIEERYSKNDVVVKSEKQNESDMENKEKHRSQINEDDGSMRRKHKSSYERDDMRRNYKQHVSGNWHDRKNSEKRYKEHNRHSTYDRKRNESHHK